MTDLRKKTLQLSTAEYSALIAEAGYWIQQPEIGECLAVSVLAAHTEGRLPGGKSASQAAAAPQHGGRGK